MKKYVTLQCSTCKRTKDSLINLTHYAPDRCTITLNCEGRLSPIGYTSGGTSVLSVPPTGLTNWFPRGDKITTTAGLMADTLYATSTGTSEQFVIAVSDTALGFTPGPQAKLTLNLIAEQQTAKDYRQYAYRRTAPFTVINGVEDGVSKKVLRYNITGAAPDLVEVYVNGVKREFGADYQLNDGGNGAVPPNSVLFNTLITGSSTQVDVVITKASTVSSVLITLSRAVDNEARVGTGAWEGIDAVESARIGKYSLFYCDFLQAGSALALDIRLRLSSASVVNTTLSAPYPVTSAAILLSNTKLFTQLDRQRAMWVPISSLVTNTEYMVVKLVNGTRALLVTEAAATSVFPVLNVIRFHSPSLQVLNLTGNTDAASLDNGLIIGPDA